MARYKEEYLDTDRLYKLVGRNIQRLRQQAGMTQEDLAAALFCTQKQISQVEAGRSHPALDFYLRTANIFHVTADYLLKGVVELSDVQLSGTDAERIFIEDVFQVTFFGSSGLVISYNSSNVTRLLPPREEPSKVKAISTVIFSLSAVNS